MKKLIVHDTSIQLMEANGIEYICLTDMLKARDGQFFVTDWLRNRNTLEYIGIWEQLSNPSFNYGEFAIIKTKAGLNNFKISVKDFVEQTNAISLQAKPGRYGGTYAHKDIAFEFAMWISPEFKIYLIREFQRLKAEKEKAFGWSAKRELAKVNHLSIPQEYSSFWFFNNGMKNKIHALHKNDGHCHYSVARFLQDHSSQSSLPLVSLQEMCRFHILTVLHF
jgi:hypothetical protein